MAHVKNERFILNHQLDNLIFAKLGTCYTRPSSNINHFPRTITSYNHLHRDIHDKTKTKDILKALFRTAIEMASNWRCGVNSALWGTPKPSTQHLAWNNASYS